MNKIIVNFDGGNPYKSGSGISLDINGVRKAQIGFDVEHYVRVKGRFDEAAAEFAYFTSVIYGCDRAVDRESHEGDRWTREFSVDIPVVDPGKWSAAYLDIERMLEFLTGDIWHVSFVSSKRSLFGSEFKRARRRLRLRTDVRASIVSLFSGGLDSLVGAIDWLEDNPNQGIVLASTYDAQAEKSRTDQERLLVHLKQVYGERVQWYVGRTGLCSGGEDRNFRSRSLAFIGNGVLAASFVGAGTPIIVPENGSIALNYALTPARRGSLSTRTCHPYFIGMASKVLSSLGLVHPLVNPYLPKTKGELLSGCRNRDLLLKAYTDATSCGKRGHKETWRDRHARQCGVCVPCIYRQAAVHHAGFPEERYGQNLLDEHVLKDILVHPNYDLPAVFDFAKRKDSDEAIWRSLRTGGRIDYSMKEQSVSLVKRTRLELKNWTTHIKDR